MKKIGITVSFAAILLMGGLIYLKHRKSTDFESLIKAKLQQLVKEGSNGLYVLKMEKIEVDILKSKVVVHDASLLIDSARLKVLDAAGIAPEPGFNI